MLCRSAVFLLVLVAVEVSWALTEKEKSTIVQLHNTYRSRVSPSAADMLKMEWDTTLENIAKAYAKKCIWAHNPDRGRRGENLFLISTPTVNVDIAVEDWYKENRNYNFATSACADKQMCGHYTQVVWATSNRVGCGDNFCEKVEGIEEPNVSLLVCNYEPPGNVRGRKPYTEGPPCSKCPANHRCVNLLCVQEIDLEGTTSTFFTKEETLPTKRPTSPGFTTPFKVDVSSEEVSTSHATTGVTISTLQTSSQSLVPSTDIEVELEDTMESYIATEANGFPKLRSSTSSRTSPKVERDHEKSSQPPFRPEQAITTSSRMPSEVEGDREESSQPPFRPEQAITPETTPLWSKTPTQEYAEGLHLFYLSGVAEREDGGGTQVGDPQAGGTPGRKADPLALFAVILSTYLSSL